MMRDLFESVDMAEMEDVRPLAERQRPIRLDDLVGQDSITRSGGFLAEAISKDRVPSLILCGPPGCGKTSLATVISHQTRAHFEPFSAVLGGVKDVRRIVEDAQKRRMRTGQRTILFVDEIHRFNKAQQDAFLPHVENGEITLIGATTENPSFSINSALLSRCKTLVLSPLEPESVRELLTRALQEEREEGRDLPDCPEEVLNWIAHCAGGDGRRALSLLDEIVQWAVHTGMAVLDLEQIQSEWTDGGPMNYDRSEAHYDFASALIKSMRGSDPDASLFYMCRMLEGGEDPLFLLRRLVIFASEDIGMADPRALQVVTAALQAFQFVGLPEGAIPLAQAVVHCATSPKSNGSYKGLRQAQRAVRDYPLAAPPKHLLNAPTSWMKKEGYGKGYRYPHDEEGGVARGVTYLPDELAGKRFYEPTERGYEAYVRERLRDWRGEADS